MKAPEFKRAYSKTLDSVLNEEKCVEDELSDVQIDWFLCI